jgi:lysophospholipase L1-like esterase
MTTLTRTVEKLRKGEHVTIVALGDSNTEVTFHTRGAMNYCGLLSEAIFEAYGHGVCTLINAGKCGSSFSESLTRLDRDVLRFKPDAVLVGFGMNDATRGDAGLPGFRDSVREVVRRIVDNGSELLLRTPNPVVALHGMPLPPGAEPGRPAVHGNRKLKEYAGELVTLAAQLHVPIVDHYTLWTNKRVAFRHPVANPTELWPLMGDAIHPGALGHLRFFRELAPFFDVSREFPWEDVTR